MREVQWISVVDPDRFWAILIRILRLSSKKIRRTLISTFLLLLCFLEDCYNVPSKGNTQKKLIFITSWNPLTKWAGSWYVGHWCGSGSIPKCHGSIILQWSRWSRDTKRSKGLTFENTIKPCRAKLTLQTQVTYKARYYVIQIKMQSLF
jgi:hypothetical protein